MPEQPAAARTRNFQEVALGYDEKTAVDEAQRCLNCPKPMCVTGCPVNVYIPKFIHALSENKFAEAINIIKEKNALPAVCGRVCPQENQCESKCVLGIKGQPVAIGRLERFAADYARQHKLDAPKATAAKLGKVAIVGSGPSGLAAAGSLSQLGYQVTVFEAFHTAGGVLMYGIPPFRLPKDIVQHEVDSLKTMGVKIIPNVIIGRTFTIEDLLGEEGFGAIYIATGAGLPHFMHIPGENLNGVYAANEFLTRVNLMGAYKFPQVATPVYVGQRVAVVGGGNVAMDSARTAMRLGAEHVYIVYRRSEEELPARREEVQHAREEGIEFKLLHNPTKILGNPDGWVTGIECLSMELGAPDASGRRSPKEIPGSAAVLPVNMVIMAIGQSANPLLKQTTPELKVNQRGNIVVTGTGETSIPGVFAGGDIVTGAATVISAMGAGKRAAAAIHEYLQHKKN